MQNCMSFLFSSGILFGFGREKSSGDVGGVTRERARKIGDLRNFRRDLLGPKAGEPGFELDGEGDFLLGFGRR